MNIVTESAEPMVKVLYIKVHGALLRQFNLHTHLGPCDPKISHETRGEGQKLSGDSHLGLWDLKDSYDALPEDRPSSLVLILASTHSGLNTCVSHTDPHN